MPSSTSNARLFKPIDVGSIKLQHRVVLSPMTRLRASKQHVISDLAAEYYSQRGSTPGTLLISESIAYAPHASGLPHIPGIWTEEQIAAWKRVTDAVHAKGSYIVAQLSAMGKFAMPEILKEDGYGAVPIAASAGPTETHLHELTKSEIAAHMESYEKAAKNAVAAGFDGVELHGGNTDLVEQFLSDMTNHRTDEYGGSIGNRARYTLEALKVLVSVVGQEKVGIRFTPWSRYGGLRMDDPIPTFTYVIQKIKELYPAFMWIHMVEPRISGVDDDPIEAGSDSNSFAYDLWTPRVYLSAGGYSNHVDKGVAAAEKEGSLIVFGRAFIANPDLPVRIRKGIPLNPYNRATFYLPEQAEGYIDQPFAEEGA
ncbi:putative NADPH2 dehydrogenase chain OYE2 [Clavulina sp. PMI_390]|nr:putative NADPH2 dehydrogenase chain OYE2 [Clavulina sp. PMI_390]